MATVKLLFILPAKFALFPRISTEAQEIKFQSGHSKVFRDNQKERSLEILLQESPASFKPLTGECGIANE